MKRIALATALLLATIAPAAQAQNVSATEKAAIEAAVREQVLAYFRAVDMINVDNLMTFWSREKTIGFAASGKLTPTVDAMTSDWKTGFALRLRQSFQCQDVQVRVLAPETVMSTCIGPIRIEYKNGNINNFNYLATMLWMKEAGAWKVVFLQETTAAR